MLPTVFAVVSCAVVPVARAANPIEPSLGPTQEWIEGTWSDPAWSPDGSRLAACDRSGGRSVLVLFDREGNLLRRMTDGVAHDREPVFSPDGRQVAWASDRAGSWDLWMAPVEGGEPTRLTKDPGDERNPTWSGWPVDVVDVDSRNTVARVTNLLYDRCDAEGCSIGFVSSDARGSGVVSGTLGCHSPAWSPEEVVAWECDRSLVLSRMEGKVPSDDDCQGSGTWVSGEGEKVLGLVGPRFSRIASFEGYGLPVYSANGAWLLATDKQQVVWAMRQDGTDRHAVGLPVGASQIGWAMRGLVWVQGADMGPLRLARTTGALDDVVNLWQFPEFYARVRGEDLDRRGFVAVPGEESDSYFFPGIRHRRPSLVTTDAVLDRLHRSVQLSLAVMEETVARPALERLAGRMAAHWGDRWERDHSATNRRMLTLFKVAQRLAAGPGAASSRGTTIRGGTAAIDAEATRLVRLILGARGVLSLPGPGGEGILVDLSLFRPRGRHACKAMEGFFRARTWLSEARHLAWGEALELYDSLVETGEFADWKRLFDLSGALAGAPEDLHPGTIERLRSEQPSLFGPEGNAKGAIEALRSLASSRRLIASSEMTDGLDNHGYEKRFSVLPQRFGLDAAILQKLAERRPARGEMPSAVEIMAVLGSSRAAELLHAGGVTGGLPNGEEPWAGFEDPDLSNGNLVQKWIALLAELVRKSPDGPGVPPFMRHSAWSDKTLVTALASYAQLKHDTLLESLQARRAVGRMRLRDSCPHLAEVSGRPDDEAFVEPVPEVFGRALAVIRALSSLLEQFPEAADERLYLDEERTGLLERFARIASAEVEGRTVMTPIGEFKTPFVRPRLECSSNLRDAAVVADIFTDPRARRVREVAVGRMDELFALVPRGDGRVLVEGQVFSFYEFDVPQHRRTTDAEWRGLLEARTVPPRPAWVTSYLWTGPSEATH